VNRLAIRRGERADLAAIRGLLERAKLPTDDLASAPGLQTWVLEVTGDLAGAVALEGARSAARLLRSLVVAPPHQGRGLGQSLVARVECDARAEGVQQLVLLTETAQGFFGHLGYRIIERSAAPEPLQQSGEFRFLCPASAVCMAKSLGRG
jgi:N-acetylglutamate synthase-like GNAT family acetyltransferase